MKHARVLCAILLLSVSTVQAQNLLANTDAWQIRTANVDTSFSGNAMTVTTSGTGAGIITYTDTQVTDYSLTATLSSSDSHNGVGISFSYGNLGGYFFYVTSRQQFVLSKFDGSTIENVRYNSNSWIDPVTNTISVSRFGATIKLFCNGVMVDSLQDNTYTDGRVGLFVSGNTEATYSSLSISAQQKHAVPKTCYDLDAGGPSPRDGWYTSYPFLEQVQAQDNTLQFTAQDTTFPAFTYVNGAFENAHCRTVIKKHAGQDGNVFGVAFYDVRAGSGTSVLALVRKAGFKQYGIIAPNSTGYYTTDFSPLNSSGYDTLALIKEGDGYSFRINGTDLDSTLVTSGFSPNAAGVYIGGGLTVACSELAATPDTNFSCPITIARAPSPQAPVSPVLRRGDIAQTGAFSLMGRRLSNVPVRLPSGVYIVPTRNGNVTYMKRLQRAGR